MPDKKPQVFTSLRSMAAVMAEPEPKPPSQESRRQKRPPTKKQRKLAEQNAS